MLVLACLRPEMNLYPLLESCVSFLYQRDRFNAQDWQNFKSFSLWKWHCELYAKNGNTLCTKLQKQRQSLCKLSLHLIMECKASLGPVKQDTTIIDLICNLMLCKNGLIKSEKMPTSLVRFSLLKNDLGEFLDILERL